MAEVIAPTERKLARCQLFLTLGSDLSEAVQYDRLENMKNKILILSAIFSASVNFLLLLFKHFLIKKKMDG